MERHPMFMDQKIKIIMMATLPKLLHRFSSVPIKIKAAFLEDVIRLILKFICKDKTACQALGNPPSV